MVVGDVAKVEELIRNTALTKGIRTTEFFLDYDKMRTGNVTSEDSLFSLSNGRIFKWLLLLRCFHQNNLFENFYLNVIGLLSDDLAVGIVYWFSYPIKSNPLIAMNEVTLLVMCAVWLLLPS